MIKEDYKNKYEQLTKLIKDLYPFMSDYCKEKAEGIIPELKESEDERISRALISLLKFSLEDNSAIAPGFNETKEQAVAWLEKQGKTSWKPSKEEMDVLYGLSYITNEFDERKEEVITRLYQDLKRVFFNGASFENMFPTNTSAEFEKQGVNKHKFIIGDIISNNNIIYRVDNIVKNCIGQDCYFLVDIESENNGTRYLKLIDSKGKTHNSGETIWLCEQVDAKFEKQGKTKPSWSKEDERNLKGIIREIEINKFNAPDYYMATYDGFLSWLKSLKDRVQLQTKH